MQLLTNTTHALIRGPLVHQLGALPCSMVNSLTHNTEEQCKFMIDNDCLEDEAVIDYVYLVFCEISYDMRYAGMLLIASLVVILFLNLSAVADEFLCPSLLTVAKNLRMSDSLAGVTLLAFGNGCPDIFSSLAAASSGRPELIVGELLGAGIFCTSIVAGLIFINNDFKVARRPLLRDTSFYLLAVYLIWLYCRQGRVTFYGSIAFIVIYVIYLFIALSGQAIHSRMRGDYPLATATHCHGNGGGGGPLAAAAQGQGGEKNEKSTPGGGGGDHRPMPQPTTIIAIEKCEAGAVELAGASERTDEYESWFAWRDESGRRRSSVKMEQLERARLEVAPLGGGGGSLGGHLCPTSERPPPSATTTTTTTTTIHHKNHESNNNKNYTNKGGLQVRRDSRATTFVELARRASVIAEGEESCDQISGGGGGELVKGSQKGLESLGANNKLAPGECQAKAAIGGGGGGDVVSQCTVVGHDSTTTKTTTKANNSFTLAELDDFLFHVNPINSIVWAESRLLTRLMSILRAPILFITILTVPVVDYEKRNNNWCRLLNSLHCFLVPGALIMLTKLGDDKQDEQQQQQQLHQMANHTAAAVMLARSEAATHLLAASSGGAANHSTAFAAAAPPPGHYNAASLLLPPPPPPPPPAGTLDLASDHTATVASSLVHQLDGFESLQVILLLAPGFLLGLFVFNTTQANKAPKYHTVFAYFGFAMSVAWIYVLATEIVSLLKTIGIIFSMTDTAIGLSVLAWGNSLGDIVANLTLAEAGYARMALGASIGAPLLNLLLGFGLSFSYSLKPGGWAAIEYGPTTTLLASTLALVLILLMLSTLAPPGTLRSKKPLGYLLIACYGLYFSLAVCLESGLFE